MKLDWRETKLTKLNNIKILETILIWLPWLHIDSGQQLHKFVLQRQIFISLSAIWQPSFPLKVAQEYCVEFPTRIEENNWFIQKFQNVIPKYLTWCTYAIFTLGYAWFTCFVCNKFVFTKVTIDSPTLGLEYIYLLIWTIEERFCITNDIHLFQI